MFDLLDIDTLHVVQGALRQGVLYELSVGDLPLHTAASNLAAL
jgi:exopolyphosphatase/pppGpp-phosphohydrolase